jgi:hypothetical protein
LLPVKALPFFGTLFSVKDVRPLVTALAHGMTVVIRNVADFEPTVSQNCKSIPVYHINTAKMTG